MTFPDYKLKALTDIWTGDVEGKQDKLRLTGIKGSIRWWYEALVRGLNGYACNPTDAGKCELVKDKLLTFQSEYQKTKNVESAHIAAEICPACRLFGCTGWGAKVRLEIKGIKGKDIEGDPIIGQIKANSQFIMKFIPLKTLTADEKNLLNATIKLIVEYGAIGGKTVLKPSVEPGRENERHHEDYGLIAYADSDSFEEISRPTFTSLPMNDYAWASLKHMWFVEGKSLARQSRDYSAFNMIIGRPESKANSAQNDSWLAGSQGVSKKVFSFKSPPRTFGFVEVSDEGSFNSVKVALEAVWGANGWSFISGNEVLRKYFKDSGDEQ